MIRPMKGRILWETAFFGLLTGLGLAALLVAMVLGALVSAGAIEFGETASTFFDHLTAGGGAISIAILALSYLTGGYVAARMARFDGWRQGLGLWLLSALVVAAGAGTAWISGGTLDPTDSISIPGNPIDTGPLQNGWVLFGACVLLSLLAAIAGGLMGESYHRALDREQAEPEAAEPEDGETEERGPDGNEPEAESEKPTEAVPA
jgi:hypothetical protein